MSFSSIAAMLSAAQVSGQPLHAVIRDADCQENGYDAAASQLGGQFDAATRLVSMASQAAGTGSYMLVQ